METFNIDSINKTCSILKQEHIKEEISNYLNGYNLNSIEKRNNRIVCYFSNRLGNTIKLISKPDSLSLFKITENSIEKVNITKEDSILIRNIEKRDNGIILTDTEKKFANSYASGNRTILVDIYERTYTYTKETIVRILGNIDFDNITPIELFHKIHRIATKQKIEKDCDFKNEFSTHLNSYISWENGRRMLESIYSNQTYLNGVDISLFYDIVCGYDKLSRIYNLYRGIITPQNEYDIHSIYLGILLPECFGLRELKSINEKEDTLVGKTKEPIPADYIEYLRQLFREKYKYPYELNIDRQSIIKAIEYQKSKVENKQINKSKESIAKKVLKRIRKINRKKKQ